MEKEELKELFKKYHEGTCTEEEKALLEAWYLQYNEAQEPAFSPRKVKAIKDRVYRSLPGNHHEWLKDAYRLLAAVLFIGIMITAGLKIIHLDSSPQTIKQLSDIKPGSNKAVLTLANGHQINLNDAQKGQLTATASKTKSGEIVYDPSKINESTATNNITTPRAGQWQVRLPDGTKVWINSASSLTYPVSFTGSPTREVTLIGEAYFEVAKDKAHPFIVKSSGQEIEVLGTHFNINAYPDEPTIKSTLLEGAIKISYAGAQRLIKPGQQTITSQNHLAVAEVDTETVVAWKNGDFIFKDEDFRSAMRQIARWYNVDVVYSPSAPVDFVPGGWISRKKNISEVLKIMESTEKVHFMVEGRRVTITK